MLTLADQVARATIDPGLGAALTSYSVATAAGRWDLLRPMAAGRETEPFAQACNLMLPWANRISGGGFRHAAGFASLAPNFADQECPLHGNALQAAWEPVTSSPTAASLQLRSRGPGPFDYTATVSYALHDGELRIDLCLRHEGQGRLPYGLGLHPWFVRTPCTTVQAKVGHAWLMDGRQLPRERVPIHTRPEWDFSVPRPLPETFVDNPLAGWDGGATIAWPTAGARLQLQASGCLARRCHLYAPAADAGFFCFEPTSHLPDAHNFAGYGTDGGLVELGPGDELAGRLVLAPAVQLPDRQQG